MDFGELKITDGQIVYNPVNGTVWMTQHQIADLFDCFVSKINANVRSILKSGVLDDSQVCYTYTYKSGNSVEMYNIEMITALAFRIKSRNAEVFREWLMRKATARPSSGQVLIFGYWHQRVSLN